MSPNGGIWSERMLDLERRLREDPVAASPRLREAIGGMQAEPFVRAGLVQLAPLMPAAEAEEMALSVLSRDPSDVVQIGACRALAQVGGAGALDSLARFAEQASEGVRQAAAFAHLVVSHRLNRPSPFLRLPRREEGLVPGDGPTPALRFRPWSEAKRRAVLRQLQEGRFSLGEVAPDGLELRCQGVQWAVALHRPAAERGLAETLRRSPSVLGVMARLSEEDRRWSVARIVLGGPLRADGCYMAIYRRDGALDLYGTGLLADGIVELVAARRPGAAPAIVSVSFLGELVIQGTAGAPQKGRAPIPWPQG